MQLARSSRWCERISDSYFREQSNALSNIGFMTTGLIMFWILARETRISGSRFHGSAPTAILYAATAWFLGPGSAFNAWDTYNMGPMGRLVKYDYVYFYSLASKFIHNQKLERKFVH